MPIFDYALSNGQYVWCEDGVPKRAPSDTIALAFDKKEGVLHKHGDPTLVTAWHLTNDRAWRNVSLDEWADNLVVVEGRFPLDEINKCLANGSYTKTFYEKLQNGGMSAVSYGPEASSEVPAHPAP